MSSSGRVAPRYDAEGPSAAADREVDQLEQPDRARRGRSWSSGLGPVLLVADADPVGAAVDGGLRAAGLTTLWCRDGAEALVEFGRRLPDAVLLAPRLTLVDTPTVVRAIRDAGSQPILVGVGPGDLDIVGPALLNGATGAVSRPYVAAELVGRLETEIHDVEQRFKLVYGPLELDPWAYRVKADGVVWDSLPLKEFELLRLLMTHADRVVSVEQIRSALWGDKAAGPSSNAVNVHVGRLRQRLAGTAELRTVRGLGYRLTV